MKFGEALEWLKCGMHIARPAWVGTGSDQWLAYMPGYDNLPAKKHAAKALSVELGAPVLLHPYIAMRDVHGGLVPWVPSQTDILADDWVTIPSKYPF